MRDANASLMNATLTGTTTGTPFVLTPAGGIPYEGEPFCCKIDQAVLASGTGTVDVVIQALIGAVWTTAATFPQLALGTAPASSEHTRRVVGTRGATQLRAVATIVGTTPSVPIAVQAVTGDTV